MYTGRGNAYLAGKDYAKAALDFTEAIRLRLDNPEPYKGRGIARIALGQYRDAVDDFNLCLARKPDYQTVLWNAPWHIPASATMRIRRRTWTRRSN